MARRTIQQRELDGFEIDEDNGRLYWQGERVMTDVRLSLSKTANVAVVMAGIATFGIFMLGALQAVGVIKQSVPTVVINISKDLLEDAGTSVPGVSEGYSGTRTRRGTSRDAGD